MTTSEKVAYLKGLADGMGLEENTTNGKLLRGIIDVLEDLALDLADTKDALSDLVDGVGEISDDLAGLEDEFYEMGCSGCCEDDEDDEDEDDEEPVFYSVECPNCGARLTVDEDIVDENDFACPECDKPIDFDDLDLEEVDFEDEDDE